MSLPITPSRTFEYFSRDKLERLNRETFHLMERAGMEFGLLEAKCTLAKIGRHLEEETNEETLAGVALSQAASPGSPVLIKEDSGRNQGLATAFRRG